MYLFLMKLIAKDWATQTPHNNRGELYLRLIFLIWRYAANKNISERLSNANPTTKAG